MKTVIFSETIAACDLKVGRCRQLIEIIRYVSIEGQGYFFTIYFPCSVCFVLYLAKISGEGLHWSSGFHKKRVQMRSIAFSLIMSELYYYTGSLYCS